MEEFAGGFTQADKSGKEMGRVIIRRIAGDAASRMALAARHKVCQPQSREIV